MRSPSPSVWFLAVLVLGGGVRVVAAAPGGGDEVAVVYNLNAGPDSRLVAEHYAARRSVPSGQVLGLRLPVKEAMTRAEYKTQLEGPLLDELEKRRLFRFHEVIVPAEPERPGQVVRVLGEASIRYLVLTYGVPTRVLQEEVPAETPPGAGAAKEDPTARRNDASVDSELALLPWVKRLKNYGGPQSNPFFRLPDGVPLHPTNGVLMVARLDGPSGRVAQELVDKALAAETNGLWGRAYFDARGLTEGPYRQGDDWIKGASEIARRQGFETILDTRSETFSISFPMPQIALYAGWYEGSPAGPFRRESLEFMPGAIGYHIYSFSASTVRSRQSWVGALLALGVTATVGYVQEPYLAGTLHVDAFYRGLFERRLSLGEAAYRALPVLSWQSTVIGDPLYRPFKRPLEELGAELQARRSPYLEWFHLRVVDLNLAGGEPASEAVAYLRRVLPRCPSAVLCQKLGDLFVAEGRSADALLAFQEALQSKPSPHQKVHLQLGIARLLATLGRGDEALAAYEDLLRGLKTDPGALGLYREALALAEKLGRPALAEKFGQEIERRTPAPKTEDQPKAAPR